MAERGPEILTVRLDLRILQLDDAPDVFSYARDPLIAEDTSWEAHESLDDGLAYVSACVALDSDEPGSLRHVWGIRQKGEKPVVGTIDLVQDTDVEAHVDYALARPLWGQGYMTEAVSAVTAWGFQRLPGLVQIRSGCLARNVGSARVLEKAGFRLVHRRIREDHGKPTHRGLEGLRFLKSRPPAIVVRRAEPRDAPRIAEIHVLAWQRAYAGIFPIGFLAGLSVAERTESWRARLEAGSSTMLVAEADQVMGWISVGPSRDAGAPADAGEIYALYVDPDAWRQSIGRRLCASALSSCRDAGYGDLHLWVLEQNAQAREFYERMGFRLDPGAVKMFVRESAQAPAVRYLYTLAG